MSAPAVRVRYTPAEYLELERASKTKHELVNGEILAMAGASPAHNRVGFNLAALMGAALVGSSCQGFTSDQRVAVHETGLYSYPDLTVVCGEARYDPRDADTLLNPTLLVEVLSPSTELWDRSGKFAHYRRIPSLREYFLAAQDQMCVERYARRGGDWLLTEFSGPDAVLELTSIPASIPLHAIYDRVPWPTPEA